MTDGMTLQILIPVGVVTVLGNFIGWLYARAVAEGRRQKTEEDVKVALDSAREDSDKQFDALRRDMDTLERVTNESFDLGAAARASLHDRVNYVTWAVQGQDGKNGLKSEFSALERYFHEEVHTLRNALQEQRLLIQRVALERKVEVS